jgi:H+/Cl- antiporter ClcA
MLFIRIVTKHDMRGEHIMSQRKAKEENKLLILKNTNHSTILGVSFLKWVFIGTIVGILTGSIISLFLKSLELATNLRMNNPWLLFLLPFGGAFVSFIYSKHGKNSSKGNNLIIEKINESSGDIPLRMAPLVFLGTFITHLFGGSAGREGTGVQIGSSIAESIGHIFKLDKIDTRIILMCGISSGFGSVFGTPLAGTIFGLEVATLGTMSYEGLIPCFTAAFVGNLVTEAFGISHTHYKILGIPEITYTTVLKVVFAAILFGLVSKLFSELTHKLKEVFSKGFKNTAIKSMVGGVIIIALTYIVGTRDYLGLSLPLITDAFTKQVSPFASLGKLIFTSLTLSTGFQGGEVTPLFVIGSTFGNTLSGILNISPSLLAALGLIGVFAGATNAPITSFILGIEMFGSQGSQYMFMTCAISYLFSGHSGIYISQKISTSKSKLIHVPKEATLSHFRNKSKET